MTEGQLISGVKLFRDTGLPDELWDGVLEQALNTSPRGWNATRVLDDGRGVAPVAVINPTSPVVMAPTLIG